MVNFLMKDPNLFETIDDDVASKISGGVQCTEELQSRVVSGLRASGVLTQAQANALAALSLADFCLDFGEYLEIATGVKILDDTPPPTITPKPSPPTITPKPSPPTITPKPSPPTTKV